MEQLAALVAGVSCFLFLAYAIRARALHPAESRVKGLRGARSVIASEGSDGVALLKRAPATPFSRWLRTRAYAERWELELERANLKLRPSEYFLARLILATLGVLIVWLVGRSGGAFLLGLVAGAVAYMLPAYFVRFKIRGRKERINSQLVETVELIANSLRAGFAFSQGVEVAANRVGPPMSTELSRLLLDVNLGQSLEDALAGLNKRIDSDDVDMVVTAILIQRTSGGNLAEVLDKVTETMRERERIQGEIRTLTSQQRLTAWVLTLWPVALGLIFFAINPSLTSLLWRTEVGLVLLVVWCTLVVLAGITYRRILSFDI